MTAVLGVAHGVVLLAPAEDTLDDDAARLGDAVADMAGGAPLNGTGAAAVLATASFFRRGA